MDKLWMFLFLFAVPMYLYVLVRVTGTAISNVICEHEQKSISFRKEIVKTALSEILEAIRNNE
jgi:hypothetical protein